nr:hypothetical protein [Tanacetum cinerariifolium]
MARLAFCDYHNMISILEKYEHNTDFHQIVDFVEASHLRYALTYNPTVYVSYIRQFWSTARIKTTDEGTKILATVDGTPTEPHHTPTPKATPSPQHELSSPSFYLLQTKPLPTVIPFDNPPLRQYTKRTRIAQSLVLPPVADEPASPLGDDSHGKACPTDSGLKEEQDRANITKTSTLPSDSTPRVTSLAADEGNMQHKLTELMNLCTRLERQQAEMASKINAQEEDALIKGRSLDKGEAAAVERSTKRGSDDTEEMVIVLASLDAASILTSGVSIDVEVARELEEEMERDAQRMNEQIARDAEIARIHVEEELQMMIDGLDRNNETVAKYLQEYNQFAAELPIGRRIELISDLVKYQENYAKVLKFQTQQRKPLSRKQQGDFYMSVLRSHAGERFKRKGLRLEQESAKKVKITEEVPEEKLKEMTQLIPVKEVYVKALQVKHPIIDWEVHTEGERSY